MKPPKTFEELQIGDKLYYYDKDDCKIFEQEIIGIYPFLSHKQLFFKTFSIMVRCSFFKHTVVYDNQYFYTSFKECKERSLNYHRSCVKVLIATKEPYNATS